MNEKLEDLGWIEAKLFNLSYDGKKLKFNMLDILSYDTTSKFEVVIVSISSIESLKIELSPFINGKYQQKITPIDIGKVEDVDEAEGFEGIIYKNILTDIKADYFWISSDLKANNIEIMRTGEFKYIEQNAVQ